MMTGGGQWGGKGGFDINRLLDILKGSFTSQPGSRPGPSSATDSPAEKGSTKRDAKRPSGGVVNRMIGKKRGSSGPLAEVIRDQPKPFAPQKRGSFDVSLGDVVRDQPAPGAANLIPADAAPAGELRQQPTAEDFREVLKHPDILRDLEGGMNYEDMLLKLLERKAGRGPTPDISVRPS